MEASSFLSDIESQGFGPGFLMFVTLFTFVFFGFFVLMINKGKNWARITFLVLSSLGGLFTIPLLFNSLEINFFSSILGIAQIGMQLIAIALLFQKPSSDWFVKKR